MLPCGAECKHFFETVVGGDCWELIYGDSFGVTLQTYFTVRFRKK